VKFEAQVTSKVPATVSFHPTVMSQEVVTVVAFTFCKEEFPPTVRVH
jgi:hypothetical protein